MWKSGLILTIFLANHGYVPATSEFKQCIFFLPWCLRGPSPPHWRRFVITHNDASQSVGIRWTSDQDRCRDLYLTVRNTHNRQTSLPSAGFEPTIPTSQRPQTHALDRAATGICIQSILQPEKLLLMAINTV